MLTSIRRNHKLSNRRIAKFSSGYESSRSTSRDSATDNSEKSSTPYRLPKLLLDSDDGFVEKESEVKEVEQIFGRFGYEYVVRLPELKPLTPAEIISPQRLLSQRYRQVSLVPRLRTAEILPEYRHTPSLERENRSITDDVISPHSLEQNSQSDRTMTARSNSVQWKLGQGNNGVFDITGQSNVQGPFSRSFKVRCRAPPSWMRMKWGRSKTMIL